MKRGKSATGWPENCGILAIINNEAELAGILGHEIGHVTQHHGAKQIVRSIGAQILAIGGAIANPKKRGGNGWWSRPRCSIRSIWDTDATRTWSQMPMACCPPTMRDTIRAVWSIF